MPTLVDTGFLFALSSTKDVNHSAAHQAAQILSDALILPVTVLPEICYSLHSL